MVCRSWVLTARMNVSTDSRADDAPAVDPVMGAGALAGPLPAPREHPVTIPSITANPTIVARLRTASSFAAFPA